MSGPPGLQKGFRGTHWTSSPQQDPGLPKRRGKRFIWGRKVKAVWKLVPEAAVIPGFSPPLCSRSLQDRIRFSHGRYQQSSSKVPPNTNQQWWQDPAETARSPKKQHESAGVTRTSQNARSSLPCLSRQSEDQGRQETNAMQVHCPLSPIHTLSKYHV
ncbi:rCG50926, isoform CRA_c, partial [Rattus norvegicus]